MKQRLQVAALVILIALAFYVWSFELRKHTSVVQIDTAIEKYKVLAVENPQIRWAELQRAQKTEYKSTGRNLFSVIAPPTPQEVKANQKRIEQARAVIPQPIPIPAPTEAKLPPNLKYFGYGTLPEGSTRRAFITDGEDVYVVPEGDTLLGRYRILKVGNSDLEFQEISTGLHGTTPLEEPPSSPSL